MKYPQDSNKMDLSKSRNVRNFNFSLKLQGNGKRTPPLLLAKANKREGAVNRFPGETLYGIPL